MGLVKSVHLIFLAQQARHYPISTTIVQDMLSVNGCFNLSERPRTRGNHAPFEGKMLVSPPPLISFVCLRMSIRDLKGKESKRSDALVDVVVLHPEPRPIDLTRLNDPATFSPFCVLLKGKERKRGGRGRKTKYEWGIPLGAILLRRPH